MVLSDLSFAPLTCEPLAENFVTQRPRRRPDVVCFAVYRSARSPNWFHCSVWGSANGDTCLLLEDIDRVSSRLTGKYSTLVGGQKELGRI